MAQNHSHFFWAAWDILSGRDISELKMAYDTKMVG